ncbi:MAG: NERD domain-containing protein, partial [Chloroflexota bacterium]|nr:NERD domain-containing protein [Chloroflexota bacterium]
VIVAAGLPARLPGGAAPLGATLTAFLLAAPWVAFVIARRAAGRAARFGAGARGEDALARTLRRELDDEWTLYRNLRLPGRRADLDAVLTGPPGVVLLENKAYRGDFVLFGDDWYRAAGPDGRDLQPWRGSPTAQAARNGERLAEYLAGCDPDLAAAPLHAIVVLSSGRVREARRRPGVPVVPLPELPHYLKRLPRARRPGREHRAALAAALDALNDEG